VLPARRVLAAAVVHAVVGRGPTQGDADAGRPGVATAPVAQPAVDPRHIVARPPPREPRRRSVDAVAAKPGGVGRNRRRGGGGAALTTTGSLVPRLAEYARVQRRRQRMPWAGGLAI